jgi:hypothetical protein
MFKRYSDPNHYLFAIPVTRRRWVRVWKPELDYSPPGWYRKYLVLTYRYEPISTQRGCRMFEFRFRVGTHYL